MMEGVYGGSMAATRPFLHPLRVSLVPLAFAHARLTYVSAGWRLSSELQEGRQGLQSDGRLVWV